jgi:ABC-type sugar transport system substrate-binding protein
MLEMWTARLYKLYPARDLFCLRAAMPGQRPAVSAQGGSWYRWLRGLFVAAALMSSESGAAGGDIRVGFVNPGRTGEAFWLLVSATMKAAAAELGIDVDIRYTDREPGKTMAVTKELLAESPDYLIATNDVGLGGAIIKLADAAQVPMILLSNDLDPKQSAEYGEPRIKYPRWLGSIVPDHEGGGYGTAEALLIETVRIKTARPLKLLALTGDVDTPASVDSVHGAERAVAVMRKLLGPGSVELDVTNLDWTEKGAEAYVRGFIGEGNGIDALWAANDAMASGAITGLREAGYHPGVDVLVGGINWSRRAIERVLDREMVLTYGGHFLGGAWAMVVLRDYHDGRDFAEEDARLQFSMGAFDFTVARRFPEFGKIDWGRIDFTRFCKTRNPGVTRYDFTPDAVLSQLTAVDR